MLEKENNGYIISRFNYYMNYVLLKIKMFVISGCVFIMTNSNDRNLDKRINIYLDEFLFHYPIQVIHCQIPDQ